MMKMNFKIKNRLKKICVIIALLPGILLILFPMYLTVISALKPMEESSGAFFAFPKSLYLDNFISIINTKQYFAYIGNTVVVLAIAIVVEVLITPIAAYTMQRNMDRKYFKFLYVFIVCGLFIPFQVRMVPVAQMMSKFHLLNRGGLAILYIAGTAAQAVFLVVGFLKSVPTEIEEAAIIDGCSPFKTYSNVMVPLIKPIVATLIIKDSLFVWNDFLLPLVILNSSPDKWTLQLFQYNFKTETLYNYNLAFASFLLSMMPIMILYLVMQKYFVAGLTSGAVKG